MEINQEYVNNVVLNLKSKFNITSDRQLAMKLNILPASFANTIKRGLLPYEKLIAYCKKEGLSLDEIFLMNNDNVVNNLSDKIETKETKKELESRKNSIAIKILNEESSIYLPLNLPTKNSYKAYIYDKNILILDIENKEILSNNYYLVETNKIHYFPMTISIDLTGDYLLKNDENITTKLTKEELEKIEIVGKIDFKFTRETFI